MALTVTGTEITSDLPTRHRADCGEDGTWTCTRVPGRPLSPDEAHQAMRLAELEWRGLGGSAEADRLRRALALW